MVLGFICNLHQHIDKQILKLSNSLFGGMVCLLINSLLFP